MFQVLIAVVGGCFGVLLAQSRVPYIRWVPLVSTNILGVAAVILIVKMSPTDTSLLNGIIFCSSVVVVSSIYAGAMWKQLKIDPTMTFWAWVWRDFTHQRFLRNSYKELMTPQDHSSYDSHDSSSLPD